ncbi:MAG: hypothetical protein HY040_03570 [Planctomycetes bacterium]|nr:hypothetical protein [Planctomycetota bacterium]
MKLWSWLVVLAFVAGSLIITGTNLPVVAGPQDKDKDKDKSAQKDKNGKDDKDKGKQDEKKKDEAKKDDTKKDDTKKEEAKVAGDRWEWKAFDPKGKKFIQKLFTKTNQKMTVMSQEINQNQEQTFYIEWTPKEMKDKNWVVTQKIIGVVMKIDIGGNVISFSSLDQKQPNNPMTDFFNALMKLELTLTIDPANMTVKSIEGREEFIKKLSETNPQMQTLLKSILSEDALKQMAEPTWGAFPPQGNYAMKTWNKKSELKLGPIGDYTTDFDYTYDGPDKLGEKISIKAKLDYKAPTASAGLPFTIKEAKLNSKDGSGVAYFDKAKGRFSSSKMSMVLVGNLSIEVGGMVTPVALTQTQDATVETFDEAPAELTAAPKGKQ